ncbi:MAG TPA: family 16 glycoside hydrolase [Xanthobacteraceae bacterium]|nr:family 16 glycoside hydrolase [Xanthobacteraceae bacterium]
MALAVSFRAQVTDTSNATTYTYNGVDIGAVQSDKIVVVGVASSAVSVSTSISGVTLDSGDGNGAVSMTRIETQFNSQDTVALFWLAVPAGNTTGNIVVTNSAGKGRCSIGVWAITGSASVGVVDHNNSTATNPAATLTTVNGGVSIGVAATRNSVTTFTWTNLTKDFDTQPEATATFSGGSATDSSTSRAITATPGSSSEPVGAFASFKILALIPPGVSATAAVGSLAPTVKIAPSIGVAGTAAAGIAQRAGTNANPTGVHATGIVPGAIYAQHILQFSAPSPNSTLILSKNTYSGTFTIKGECRTISQNAEFPWVVGNILWHYQDSTHFFAVAFQTNLLDFYKEDPAYLGNQRFIYTDVPTSALGQWMPFEIDVNGSDAVIKVNGSTVYTFTETENPYTSGKIGLYVESAVCEFRNITGPFTEDFSGLAIGSTYNSADDVGSNLNVQFIGTGSGGFVKIVGDTGNIVAKTPTGVAGTAAVGSPAEPHSQPVNGVSAATSVGSLTFVRGTTAVGVSATAAVGTPSDRQITTAPALGVQATAATPATAIPIVFNWASHCNGGGGSITGTSVTIGSTNVGVANGTFNQGDFLVAILNIHTTGSDPGSPDPVSGFTTLIDSWDSVSHTRVWVGYKFAGVSESGAYPASWSGSADGIAWALLNFDNVDPNNPIDVSAVAAYGNSGTHTVPSITPNYSNDYWLAIEVRPGANTPDTPQSPLIGLADVNGNSSAGRPEISIAGLQLTSGSATGTGTFTQASFTQNNQGVSIGLKTAPGQAQFSTVSITPLGASATGAAGSPSRIVAPAGSYGVSATAAVGSQSFIRGSTAVGVSATAALGSVAVTSATQVPAVGVSATAAAGQAQSLRVVSVIGVAANSNVGSIVKLNTPNNVGVQANTAIGALAVKVKIAPGFGVSASGVVGTLTHVDVKAIIGVAANANVGALAISHIIKRRRVFAVAS